MNVTGKKVLVFGTGLSGIGAAKLLLQVEAIPVLYDGNEKVDKEEVKKKLGTFGEVEILLGDLPESAIKELSLVVLSPGVPTDLPVVKRLKEAGLAIWGEVELAYAFSKGKVLAITGTNGKTTTTSLLGEIMKHSCPEVYVVGNIGTPYTDVALQMTDEAVTVAEISSFQLETIWQFHPAVSAILNITPDHLNRHHTMEEYTRVKEKITVNQGSEDICVLNYEDEALRAFGEKTKAQVLFFSSLRTLERGIYIKDGNLEYNDGVKTTSLMNIREIRLPGRHNHENIMAAMAMAIAFGISNEDICQVVRSFKAVEHRIEFVEEINGVVYYNDSKGTNPDAAIKGVQAMDRPTLLIGGGYDKDSSYEEWIRSFDGKVRYLVLLGQTGEKIAEAAEKCGFTDILYVETLEEAVKVCAEKANPGDAILLSPACASWGMFTNYEERGQMFKEYVRALL